MGCDRTDRIKLGMCGKHYQRLTKYGTTELPERRLSRCEAPECSRIAGTTGLCRSHYKQRHLGKELAPLRVATKDLGRPTHCTFPGCGRPHKARGLCKAHADHVAKGRELRPVKIYDPNATCLSDGCDRKALAHGLCSRHRQTEYDVVLRYGLTLEKYEALLSAQGGVCAICKGVNANGYRLSIDHDHACCPGNKSCGRCVRALLCGSCNHMIGHAKDRPERLRAGAEYIETFARGELRLM